MRVEEKCESEVCPACRQRDAEQGASFPNRGHDYLLALFAHGWPPSGMRPFTPFSGCGVLAHCLNCHFQIGQVPRGRPNLTRSRSYSIIGLKNSGSCSRQRAAGSALEPECARIPFTARRAASFAASMQATSV